MANAIKRSGATVALQVTKAARSAGLVEENAEGESTRRAPTVVYGVDGNLLIIDRDRVSLEDRAELVASAARDARSIHQGGYATIQIAGNGYQAELPGAGDAGFEVGTTSPVVPAPGLLVVSDGTADSNRRARDLASIRESQAEGEATAPE